MLALIDSWLCILLSLLYITANVPSGYKLSGRSSDRQKFDSDVGTSIRTFNDVMVRIRQFGSLISDWMER